MKIEITHKDNDRFDVLLFGSQSEPFLTIYGCKAVDGSKGRFVSWPRRKDESGKWWNQMRSSDAFANQVLKVLDATPKSAPKKDLPNMDEDIPW